MCAVVAFLFRASRKLNYAILTLRHILRTHNAQQQNFEFFTSYFSPRSTRMILKPTLTELPYRSRRHAIAIFIANSLIIQSLMFSVNGFGLGTSSTSFTSCRLTRTRTCDGVDLFMTNDQPSDYDNSDLEPEDRQVTYDTDEDDEEIRDALKRELLLISSVTSRGEFASKEERDLIVDIITQLEALNPTADPALNCEGDWDLCLASTQSFRSSPFFLAVRTLLGDGDLAERGFMIQDQVLSGATFGRVRQIISENELRSEVSLGIGFISGRVVTTAAIDVCPPEKWNLSVKETSIDNIPNAIPVGEILSKLNVQGGSAVPISTLRTFYVDEGLRITRDLDDNFFVFARA